MDRQRGLASGYAVHHVADFGGDGAGIPCDTRPPGGKKLKPWGVEHKDGEQEEKPDAASLPGAEFKKALHSPKLYCAYLWTFITGLIVYPVVYAVPAHLSKVGLDTVFSGDVVGLFSIGSVLFLLPLGWAMDRWGVRLAQRCA